MDSRLIDLEIRLTHQDAAIEALTESSLKQQLQIEEVLGQLQQIRILLQQLAPPETGALSDEPPPPHY
jgi:SlyX protein